MRTYKLGLLYLILTLYSLRWGQLTHTINGDQINNSKEGTTKRKNNIDKATYSLFEAAYDKAIEDNKLNAFRIYLMEKTFETVANMRYVITVDKQII